MTQVSHFQFRGPCRRAQGIVQPCFGSLHQLRRICVTSSARCSVVSGRERLTFPQNRCFSYEPPQSLQIIHNKSTLSRIVTVIEGPVAIETGMEVFLQ